MSKVNGIQILCNDISLKAQHAMKSGEKVEDVSEAIFEQIFNVVGRTAEMRDWAMNTADGIMAGLMPEEDKSRRIAQRATELRKGLKWALSVIEWSTGESDLVDEIGPDEFTNGLNEIRTILDETE